MRNGTVHGLRSINYTCRIYARVLICIVFQRASSADIIFSAMRVCDTISTRVRVVYDIMYTCRTYFIKNNLLVRPVNGLVKCWETKKITAIEKRLNKHIRKTVLYVFLARTICILSTANFSAVSVFAKTITRDANPTKRVSQRNREIIFWCC